MSSTKHSKARRQNNYFSTREVPLYVICQVQLYCPGSLLSVPLRTCRFWAQTCYLLVYISPHHIQSRFLLCDTRTFDEVGHIVLGFPSTFNAHCTSHCLVLYSFIFMFLLRKQSSYFYSLPPCSQCSAILLLECVILQQSKIICLYSCCLMKHRKQIGISSTI